MAIPNAGVIPGYPLGEIRLVLALDLNMNHGPLIAVPTPHLNQFISVALSQSRIARDSSQFLIQKGVPAAPVDAGVENGEEKRGESGEILLQHVFPREIIIGYRVFRSNNAARLCAVVVTSKALAAVSSPAAKSVGAAVRARRKAWAKPAAVTVGASTPQRYSASSCGKSPTGMAITGQHICMASEKMTGMLSILDGITT